MEGCAHFLELTGAESMGTGAAAIQIACAIIEFGGSEERVGSAFTVLAIAGVPPAVPKVRCSAGARRREACSTSHR